MIKTALTIKKAVLSTTGQFIETEQGPQLAFDKDGNVYTSLKFIEDETINYIKLTPDGVRIPKMKEVEG